MAERIAQGTWVELRRVVLPAGQRAQQVPDETQRVPLELRVKGVLVAEAAVGEQALAVTAAGRTLRGTLESADPPYSHGFGPPVPALRAVGEELRALLRAGRERP